MYLYGPNKSKSFFINSDRMIEIQLNGDFVGYTPAKFEIVLSSLNLLVPKK